MRPPRTGGQKGSLKATKEFVHGLAERNGGAGKGITAYDAGDPDSKRSKQCRATMRKVAVELGGGEVPARELLEQTAAKPVAGTAGRGRERSHEEWLRVVGQAYSEAKRNSTTQRTLLGLVADLKLTHDALRKYGFPAKLGFKKLRAVRFGRLATPAKGRGRRPVQEN